MAAWPATVNPHQQASAQQYNALLTSVQAWGGDVNASGFKLTNAGGVVFSAGANFDVSAGGMTFTGGINIKAPTTSIGLTVTSNDGARTLQCAVPNSGGAAPAILTSTSNFALHTALGDTRGIAFNYPAGVEENISSSSGRLRFAVPIDIDTDVVAGGKVQAATLNITSAAGITIGAGWSTWTPTITTNNAAMTITGVSVVDAQYFRVGPVLYFKVAFSFTLGGTMDFGVYCTLPVALVGNYSALAAAFIQSPAGANTAMPAVARTDSNQGVVIRYGAALNFVAGLYNVVISGFYRCA